MITGFFLVGLVHDSSIAELILVDDLPARSNLFLNAFHNRRQDHFLFRNIAAFDMIELSPHGVDLTFLCIFLSVGRFDGRPSPHLLVVIETVFGDVQTILIVFVFGLEFLFFRIDLFAFFRFESFEEAVHVSLLFLSEVALVFLQNGQNWTQLVFAGSAGLDLDFLGRQFLHFYFYYQSNQINLSIIRCCVPLFACFGYRDELSLLSMYSKDLLSRSSSRHSVLSPRFLLRRCR